MSNYDSNSDWCSFFNSGEEGNEMEIEDIMLECCNHETVSAQNDQLGNKDRVKWRDKKDHKDVAINFGHSAKLVWNQAKAEIKDCRVRLPSALRKSKEDVEKDTFGCMLDYFLGERSLLMQLMMDVSNTTYSDILKIFLACSTTKTFGLSATELSSNEYGVNTSDLPTSNEYCLIWDSLSSNVMPLRYVKPFWERFQDNLNDNSRVIIVGDRSSNVLSLDDDKKYGSISDKNYTKSREGIKVHVHPNKRKGIVGHTAASPFTHLTYAVLWEKNGETQTECYIQIIKSLFGTKPNLDRIIFASDRGYWNKPIKCILKHGGDVLGTVKRSYWYHFTYDQNIRKNDPRMLLDEKGPSTLFAAETTIEGRKMTAYAYRAGTKNISLTMLSIG